jgi:hypothetical protein
MLAFTDEPIKKIAAMTFDAYQREPGINQSLLRLFDRNSGGAPAKYRHACLHPEDRPEPSRAMEFGSAYHCLSLTPEEFERRYVVRTAEVEEECFTMAQLGKSKAKAFSTKLKTYENWVALQEEQGLTVITAKQERQLQAMRAALLDSSEVRDSGVLEPGCAFEVSLFAPYTLPSGSDRFQLKGRLDAMPVGDAIIDLKSARAASPRPFARTVADMRLDLQAAFYLDLANANGLPKKRFGFLAQDKEPPYLPSLLWMPEDWITYGRSTACGYRRILNDISESIRTKRWPGYGSEMLEWPSWLNAEIEAVAA